MNDFVKHTFSELKESRLWPLAIALVVALVAVPVLLSKPAKESATPASATTGTAVNALAELRPLATLTPSVEIKERKDVVRLSRKNPFEPLVKPSATTGGGGSTGTTGAGGSTSAGGGTQAGGDSTGSSGTTGTTGGSTGSTGGSTGSGTSKTFYYTYVADVTFGKVGDPQEHKVQQLRALPSSDNPVVVFMGATASADKAVFLVSSGATVTGEGTCKPKDDACVFLYLKAVDSASIAVGDATGALTTYDLKLHEITTKKLDKPASTSASSSAKARAAVGTKARRQPTRNTFFQSFSRLGL